MNTEPYCPTCGAGEPLQIPLDGYPCGTKDSPRMCTKCATRWTLSKEAEILHPRRKPNFAGDHLPYKAETRRPRARNIPSEPERRRLQTRRRIEDVREGLRIDNEVMREVWE